MGFYFYAKIHEEYSECLHHKDIGLHNENTVNAYGIKDIHAHKEYGV